MSEIVDRVASALYGGNIEDSYFPAWFRRKARQMIEVMREPTDEMVIAAQRAIGEAEKAGRGPTSEAVYMEISWRAMIDAALDPNVSRATIGGA